MKRFTVLLLSAILLCSCAGGQSAQNSGVSDTGTQNSEKQEQQVQNSEESDKVSYLLWFTGINILFAVVLFSIALLLMEV